MTSLGHGSCPAYPGGMLKDELEARDISQRKSADSINMDYLVLNEILNDRRSPSTITALMFEAALGVPAGSPMKLQLEYNM